MLVAIRWRLAKHVCIRIYTDYNFNRFRDAIKFKINIRIFACCCRPCAGALGRFIGGHCECFGSTFDRRERDGVINRGHNGFDDDLWWDCQIVDVLGCVGCRGLSAASKSLFVC